MQELWVQALLSRPINLSCKSHTQALATPRRCECPSHTQEMPYTAMRWECNANRSNSSQSACSSCHRACMNHVYGTHSKTYVTVKPILRHAPNMCKHISASVHMGMHLTLQFGFQYVCTSRCRFIFQHSFPESQAKYCHTPPGKYFPCCAPLPNARH